MSKQLLHLVFGGELGDVKGVDFKDLSALDVVGFYPNYAAAHRAWQAKARETIDNAQMRYFIVHLHRLLDPATDVAKKKTRKKT
ncbi:MAG: DUF4170 domain-containing protein [Rhizobiales bacterium]|nr:DUF4170 domain-containing protein [Hyphomicrobiales bacterium]MBI3672151.1 DUF4170 domain-containing protein [Hyphomicrobiales bacterium]